MGKNSWKYKREAKMLNYYNFCVCVCVKKKNFFSIALSLYFIKVESQI